MPATPDALMQLALVQQHEPSLYWQQRCDNPLLLQSWSELALANTAWSWMGAEPPPPTASVWKALWELAVQWPINDDLTYVEQALVAWSEHPVWNSVRSMKLIENMERARPRDWSPLIHPEHLQPQRFAYHLLNTICLHPNKFAQVHMPSVWKALLATSVLRADLKEVFLVTLLGSCDEVWGRIVQAMPPSPTPGMLPLGWLQQFKEAIPTRRAWLTEFENTHAQLGLQNVPRNILAEQWSIQLNRALWDRQVASYESFEFDTAAIHL